MRTLTQKEMASVSAAKAVVQTLTPSMMEIVVTYGSKFEAKGSYGGHRLNVILYANAIHDLHDRPISCDFSKPFLINTYLATALSVEGGHLYRIEFDA